jgi:hypothetical protein
MSDFTLLASYGNELVAAGFEVWLHKFGEGYLTYRDPATGNRGSLQYSLMEGWQHYMPLVPSLEYGSAMHMENPLPPFTVEAARQCAQSTNHNRVGGRTLANARDRAWHSPSAQQLHA